MKQTEGLEVVLSVRVEAALRDDIQELADKAERRFADELRRALRLYVLSQREETA